MASVLAASCRTLEVLAYSFLEPNPNLAGLVGWQLCCLAFSLLAQTVSGSVTAGNFAYCSPLWPRFQAKRTERRAFAAHKATTSPTAEPRRLAATGIASIDVSVYKSPTHGRTVISLPVQAERAEEVAAAAHKAATAAGAELRSLAAGGTAPVPAGLEQANGESVRKGSNPTDAGGGNADALAQANMRAALAEQRTAVAELKARLDSNAAYFRARTLTHVLLNDQFNEMVALIELRSAVVMPNARLNPQRPPFARTASRSTLKVVSGHAPKAACPGCCHTAYLPLKCMHDCVAGRAQEVQSMRRGWMQYTRTPSSTCWPLTFAF